MATNNRNKMASKNSSPAYKLAKQKMTKKLRLFCLYYTMTDTEIGSGEFMYKYTNDGKFYRPMRLRMLLKDLKKNSCLLLF